MEDRKTRRPAGDQQGPTTGLLPALIGPILAVAATGVGAVWLTRKLTARLALPEADVDGMAEATGIAAGLGTAIWWVRPRHDDPRIGNADTFPHR